MANQRLEVQMMYLEQAYQLSNDTVGDGTDQTQRLVLQAEILSQMGTVQKAAGNSE